MYKPSLGTVRDSKDCCSRHFGVHVSVGRGRLGLALVRQCPALHPPQLWVTDVHTEDVEKMFRSRIDQDVWFLP